MDGAVLFDLDETLIDRAASSKIYGMQFYSDFNESISALPEAFLESFMRLDGNGYVPRGEFFQALSENIGPAGPDAYQIANHFSEYAWTKTVLMDGAQDVLERLRTAGFPIGIITNGGSLNQRKKITNSGLDRLVDGIFISEELGVRKPQPEIFLGALQRLNAAARQSWFVGDNPDADIAGASSVGLKTIWLRRSLPWPEHNATCYTVAIDRLEDALNAIFRNA
ncbi:MAG: HAD family hydrolase [Pseudomonadales bacterium]